MEANSLANRNARHSLYERRGERRKSREFWLTKTVYTVVVDRR